MTNIRLFLAPMLALAVAACSPGLVKVPPSAATDKAPTVNVVNLGPANGLSDAGSTDYHPIAGSDWSYEGPAGTVVTVEATAQSPGGVAGLSAGALYQSKFLFLGAVKAAKNVMGFAPSSLGLSQAPTPFPAGPPKPLQITLSATDTVKVIAYASNFNNQISSITVTYIGDPPPTPTTPPCTAAPCPCANPPCTTPPPNPMPACSQDPNYANDGKACGPIVVPEGCSASGKWVCNKTTNKEVCTSTPGVNYCTHCGLQGALNCGSCTTQTCMTPGSQSNCAPGNICTKQPSSGGFPQPSLCVATGAPFPKCWAPS